MKTSCIIADDSIVLQHREDTLKGSAWSREEEVWSTQLWIELQTIVSEESSEGCEWRNFL